MVKLSIEISDYIATDFEGKLKAAQELGIHNIETRDRIDGKALYAMNGAEAERIRNLLIDYNMRLVLCATDLSVQDHEAWKQLMRKCMLLDVEAIKITVAADADTAYVRRLADSFGIALLIENSADGAFPDEKALHEAVRRHDAGVIFNPFEIVKTERHPFLHAFTAGKIKNDICILRISDGLYRTHEATMLAHGCAEVKELASILLCRSYKGYFSFVPYMSEMSMRVYRENIATFKNLLKHC